MPAAKPTPGPWNTDGDSVSVFSGDGPNRVKICDANWHSNAVKVAQANARLIAAAPDLLENLKECLEAFRNLAKTFEPGACLSSHSEEAFVLDLADKIEANIAKAHGGGK